MSATSLLANVSMRVARMAPGGGPLRSRLPSATSPCCPGTSATCTAAVKTPEQPPTQSRRNPVELPVAAPRRLGLQGDPPDRPHDVNPYDRNRIRSANFCR